MRFVNQRKSDLCLERKLDRLEVLGPRCRALCKLVGPFGWELLALALGKVRADVLRDMCSLLELVLESGPLLLHQDGFDAGNVLPGCLDLAQFLAGGGGGGLATKLEQLLLELGKLLEKF